MRTSFFPSNARKKITAPIRNAERIKVIRNGENWLDPEGDIKKDFRTMAPIGISVPESDWAILPRTLMTQGAAKDNPKQLAAKIPIPSFMDPLTSCA